MLQAKINGIVAAEATLIAGIDAMTRQLQGAADDSLAAALSRFEDAAEQAALRVTTALEVVGAVADRLVSRMREAVESLTAALPIPAPTPTPVSEVPAPVPAPVPVAPEEDVEEAEVEDDVDDTVLTDSLPDEEPTEQDDEEPDDLFDLPDNLPPDAEERTRRFIWEAQNEPLPIESQNVMADLMARQNETTARMKDEDLVVTKAANGPARPAASGKGKTKRRKR